MFVKRTAAKLAASLSLKMAKAFCGAASAFGAYQPKEPESLKETLKKAEK